MIRQEPGIQAKSITREQVEVLLEAVLGKPRRSLRDIHTELVMVDRQRTLLRGLTSRRHGVMYTIEDVELLLDAVEEYGGVELPDSLFGKEGEARDLAPPPLTATELRGLIAVAALRSGVAPDELARAIDLGLMKEQLRLRSDLFLATHGSPAADAPAAEAGARSRRRSGR